MLKNLRSIFNIKVILGGIIFALGVFGILVVILWSAKAKGMSQVPATAIFNIIKAPTATPIAPLQTPTPAVTPGSLTQEPPSGVDINVGKYVQVAGTGGDGLRLHKSAGVSSEVQYVAIDSEVFIVKDGPVEKDGYDWWLLQDPYTENAAGWGVSNYLVVVKNP